MASRITFYEEKRGKLKELCTVRNAPVPPKGLKLLLISGDTEERREVLSQAYVFRELLLEEDDRWHAEVSVVLDPVIKEEGAA